jgi:hypothetical protein
MAVVRLAAAAFTGRADFEFPADLTRPADFPVVEACLDRFVTFLLLEVFFIAAR